MSSRKEELEKKFERGFLGFWIRKYRISYLVVLAVIALGILAVVNIPKESSPAVSLGMVNISTVYPGTNPVDMDSLVTDKIYKEVKDIKWVDKIASSSSLGLSNISLTLKTSADMQDVIADVRSAVARVTLPTDAKSPNIIEVETDTNQAFSIFLYQKDDEADDEALFARAKILQKALEKVPGVNTVAISAGGVGRPIDADGGDDSSYDVEIIVREEKLTSLGLSLGSIATTIQGYNRDQPLGNYTVGSKKYDFRIDGKEDVARRFLDTPLALPRGGSVTLGEIAEIKRAYKNKAVRILVPWVQEGKKWWRSYVWLTVNKTDSASIFLASTSAKAKVADIFRTADFSGYRYAYGIDLADNIMDDYRILMKEALITIILVFFAMFLFVGFRDSLFATVTLPLAFLSTFILLYYGGYTMNFLTNFSLILSFGIAVDTIIVIVQAASAKIRVWFDPRSAIMLALREYAVPVISWVMTTIVVFIPMMLLPGIMGKFLAFIPITIFGVLATGLVLVLTVNSALYLLFVRKWWSYVRDNHALEYASDEEKELLSLEREGKTPIEEWVAPLRIRIIHTVTMWYKRILRNFLEHKTLRRLSIFIPMILLILSFMFLAPRVGFELFPSDDNNITTVSITWPVWQRTEVTEKDLGGIADIFVGHPEIDYTTITLSDNKADISIQLTKKEKRKKLWQMSVFDLEKILLPKLVLYEQKWYRVVSEVLKWGPPGAKAIGLKVEADDPKNLDTLIRVSRDFEAYLKTLPGTKNAGRSSSDTPWQFVFVLKREVLASAGLTPATLYSQIAQNMNGVKVASIEDDGEDRDIVVKSSQFIWDVDVNNILSLPLSAGQLTYRVGDFIESQISSATANISRQDGKIQITIDADAEDVKQNISLQAQYVEFAKTYPYPEGIAYAVGGEASENSELIVATVSAFFMALLLIFAILTLQFNSFSQPLVILYSVITSLPIVMIGLLLTGNQFSMPFGIGFIAFTGIAVNHGIILIAAINENLEKWIDGVTALVEAGSSRLEPMLLTTVTTVLGIIPIALRDRFWSGMGFTIIFGIMAASALTLFVVKGIYYELYMNKEESWIRRFYKRIKWLFQKKRKIIE
jgi:multidrug efflux pump subunit AcrB